ncbi:MAG: hypothetical protein IKD31_00135 [Clostridia bacterium]|nr:hypothetical protein [Clostridia bacterium]
MKRFLSLFLILLLFCFSSCREEALPTQGEIPVLPQEFAFDGGSITLTNAFRQISPVSFASSSLSVSLSRSAFSEWEGTELSADSPLSDFADAFLAAHHPNAATEKQGELLFCTLSLKEGDISVTARLYFFKGADAFRTVQFSAEDEHFPTLREQIEEFASSIRFEPNK